mmetsp:Transcript_61302/g.133186  ORF Transcript_61302/g.133186 Transcript_61302/m.133186 type:complete len:208 (+) Transcript_61302:2-625(+)
MATLRSILDPFTPHIRLCCPATSKARAILCTRSTTTPTVIRTFLTRRGVTTTREWFVTLGGATWVTVLPAIFTTMSTLWSTMRQYGGPTATPFGTPTSTTAGTTNPFRRERSQRTCSICGIPLCYLARPPPRIFILTEAPLSVKSVCPCPLQPTEPRSTIPWTAPCPRPSRRPMRTRSSSAPSEPPRSVRLRHTTTSLGATCRRPPL